ncbi:hypothetical protein AA106555_0547 [Neokomagataea thailandica NBRC 106555]|uniref:Flagellar protein FlgN n=2 Tax=Neokomagataea TaxID=1223423 RepID=A0A4Y6V4I3_9PROT|nr:MULTISPECIES: flagellar protein FlgN [Neokomagataea]QDH25032.1 flagellar protein FlgN [Neokomagataea tanensis]GBR51445.1 hypothetical protein AA106555_0547 [Neokomagataea thailandica NBRC 106555]
MNTIISRLAALLAILKSENSALEKANISAALALLPQKEAAAAALTEAIANVPQRDGAHTASPYQALLDEFEALSERNGELLHRAISAQRHVIELLTSSASQSEAQGYGQKGLYTPSHTNSNAPFFVSNA